MHVQLRKNKKVTVFVLRSSYHSVHTGEGLIVWWDGQVKRTEPVRKETVVGTPHTGRLPRFTN